MFRVTGLKTVLLCASAAGIFLIMPPPVGASGNRANAPSVAHHTQAVLGFRAIDRQAKIATHGSVADVRALTVSLLNQSVPIKIADAYGFTDRIVHAEMLYRTGGQAAIRESDIVTAVNNLFTSLDAPAWAHTNQKEVRRLRLALVTEYPHLMASDAPPNQKGQYAAVDESMSPVVGVYVALTMVQQKLINPRYQFTETEKTSTIYTENSKRAEESQHRSQALRRLIYQPSASRSLRDLLTLANNFFSDLGLVPNPQEVSQ